MSTEKQNTVCGVGYWNKDEEKPWQDGQYEYEYQLWSGLINRCYGKKPPKAYRGCTVSDEFKNYSYFKIWCRKQVGFNCKDEKKALFHLDKDILSIGNKTYSENTCCFIPSEINCAMVSSSLKNKELPTGVSKRKDRDSYSATLACYGKVKHLGSFSTVESAVQAWKIAKSLHILELANKWEGKIDKRVYDALLKISEEL